VVDGKNSGREENLLIIVRTEGTESQRESFRRKDLNFSSRFIKSTSHLLFELHYPHLDRIKNEKN
jgi:hypothetical protein